MEAQIRAFKYDKSKTPVKKLPSAKGKKKKHENMPGAKPSGVYLLDNDMYRTRQNCGHLSRIVVSILRLKCHIGISRLIHFLFSMGHVH